MTYDLVKSDHDYLWAIGEAYDMTGGYVDQEDLARMLANPTKTQARICMENQIIYWFQSGCHGTSYSPESIPWNDPLVCEIAERYGMQQGDTP